MRNSSYSFMPILLKLHRCFGYGLKTCMWFEYNPQIIFCHFFCNLNLVFFRRYYYQHNVDSRYLVRVTRINFNYFRLFVIFLKKFLAGDINSLNLLVEPCFEWSFVC